MKINFKIEIIFAIGLTFLLLGLCVNKFFALKTQARQGLNEKSFTAVQEALSVYRGDNEGRCPDTLEELVPFYLEKIPSFYNSKGQMSNAVKNTGTTDAFDKETAWLYVNDKTSPDYCTVFKNEKY